MTAPSHFKNYRTSLPLWVVALLVLFLSQMGLRANDIYGSGDFIINDGPVYSNTGNYIGSSNTYSGSTTLSGGTIKIGTGGYLLPFLYGTTSVQPHTLTISSVNGTVTKTPDQLIYDYGTQVTLTATPDAGYVFTGWVQGPAHITGNSGTLGSISGTTTSMNGTVVGVTNTYTGVSTTATDYWTLGGNVASYSPTYTLSTNADYDLTAHFEIISRIVSVDGSGLFWPQQVVGQTIAHSFTIRNTGNSPLNISEITYPAGYSGAWSGVIAPGASQSVGVTFAPTTPGIYAGNIEVHSDATAGTATISVSAAAENVYTLNANSAFMYWSDSPWEMTIMPRATVRQNPTIYPGPTLTLSYPHTQYTPFTNRTYWRNSVVSVQARSVSGYAFLNWTENDNVISTSQTFDLTMQATHDLQAHYETIRLGVEVSGKKEFGEQHLFSVSHRSIYLKNTGNMPAYISDLKITDRINKNRTAFYGHWSGWIAPGSSQHVSIRFKPNRKIHYSANIRPLVADGNTSITSLQVSGSGR